VGFANASGNDGFVSQTVGDNRANVFDLLREVEVEVEVGIIIE
jgi:hypothetical protein